MTSVCCQSEICRINTRWDLVIKYGSVKPVWRKTFLWEENCYIIDDIDFDIKRLDPLYLFNKNDDRAANIYTGLWWQDISPDIDLIYCLLQSFLFNENLSSPSHPHFSIIWRTAQNLELLINKLWRMCDHVRHDKWVVTAKVCRITRVCKLVYNPDKREFLYHLANSCAKFGCKFRASSSRGNKYSSAL